MTACTEPHPPRAGNDLDGEGQKDIPKKSGMTACTEPHPPRASNDLDGEGQKDIPKEAQP
jgi:hypothetical protein